MENPKQITVLMSCYEIARLYIFILISLMLKTSSPKKISNYLVTTILWKHIIISLYPAKSLVKCGRFMRVERRPELYPNYNL